MTKAITPASSFSAARQKAALRLARLLRFRDEQRGATAIEFAMVALPFTFLVISLLQFSLIFLLYSTLENALDTAARGLRTGSNKPPNAGAFVAATCQNMGWLQANCSTQLSVDVRTEAQFANATEPDPAAGGAWDPSKLGYTTGAPGQILLVRGFYRWPLIAPAMGAALKKVGDNALIVATTTFVVEPYT